MKILKILLLGFVVVALMTNKINCSDDLEDELLDDEDDDAVVEDDIALEQTATEEVLQDAINNGPQVDDEEANVLKPSNDIQVVVHFIEPLRSELIAGKPISLLVGVSNTGEEQFVIDNMDASLRYPQDYNYHIQNYTWARYDQTVEGGIESTLAYTFTPNEMLHGRPFGLTVLMRYHDDKQTYYQHVVFNDTISMQEIDEGFDGETFFMYVLLVALVMLVVFVLYSYLGGAVKKGASKGMSNIRKNAPIEMGTQENKNEVDFEWLPQEVLNSMNGSPSNRKSKSSPRQRNNASPKKVK